MSLSMYQASVPVLARALTNLRELLKKGHAHVQAKKVGEDILLQSRLYLDMFPLARQVQIATDMAKGAVARLAGVEPMKLEDNETNFDELDARIARVIEYIESFKPEQIDGSEALDIVMQTRNGDLHFKGQPYLLGFVLPNVYFHSTTAYAILRQAGVEIGKKDFLGSP